ncbi:TAXI family TRAP transporter solute-binding subunit [Muricoccus radiodurans]|uniref:TAXI family TRAP transporter solute-binding subunit n=1 Tax=Muricoccus radiodurans TaxID=2231721 RepID=UPI003CF02E89
MPGAGASPHDLGSGESSGNRGQRGGTAPIRHPAWARAKAGRAKREAGTRMGLDRRDVLIGAAGGAVLPAAGRAQAPLRLTLGTATPGGGFPVFGAAFAAAIAAADPALVIETRNTAGSLENVGLLADGRLDIALVAGETATAALGRGAGITLAAAMYSSPGLFALRADAPERGIMALRGQRIAWGARSSGLVVLARQVMAGLGLDIERDFDPVFLDRAGDGPPMVLERRVAAFWGAGVGWPGFVAIADSPVGIRFLAPDAAERARILAADASLKEMALPAGSYRGQDAAVPTVGNWSVVLARPGLPEESGHRLAAALHAARADIARRLPQASETTAENTVAAAPGPDSIHPGVRRFLRDAGLLR